MHPMSAFRAFAIACAVGLAATAAPTAADQNLNCDAYAAKAVSQQRENIALGCGFAGGAWSADTNGHRGWCESPAVAMADLVREDNARIAALDACRPKADACNQYAALATAQFDESQHLRCRVGGGRWSADVAGHRAWCMMAPVDQAIAENAARQAELGSCAARLVDLDMQEATQRAQKLMQLLSNVAKALRDSAGAAVRKMN